MTEIGDMNMPPAFKYKRVYLRGRPRHEKYDAFWRKHPPMDPAHWAKIFAPFDALDGFDEAVSAKEALYCERHKLSEGEMEDLNQKLQMLHSLTMNSRLARQHAPAVNITFFSPCADPHSEWYGRGGRYRSILSGQCRRADASGILINSEMIPLEDIRELEICDTEFREPDESAL